MKINNPEDLVKEIKANGLPKWVADAVEWQQQSKTNRCIISFGSEDMAVAMMAGDKTLIKADIIKTILGQKEYKDLFDEINDIKNDDLKKIGLKYVAEMMIKGEID